MSIARKTARHAKRLRALGRRARTFKDVRNYQALLRAKGPGTAILETRSGVTLEVRRNVWDARIVEEIYVDRPYVKGLDLPAAPVVVDIGGYIGDFALYASETLGARVVVYEPTAENFAMLEKNVRHNGAGSRVTAVNEAVGVAGVLVLNVEVVDQEVHSSAFLPDNEGHARSVPSVTLDTVFERHALEHVDLLKVDCEGGEYDIFSGVSDSTLARVSNIVAETHELGDGTTEAKRAAINVRLRAAGFAVTEEVITAHTSMVRAVR